MQYKGPNGSKFTWGSIGYKNFLVAGGDNCEAIHVYEFNSNKPVSTYTGFNSDVTCVKFSYDESRLYAGSFGGTLFVYNYERGKVTNTLRGHLTFCRWVVGQKEDMGNYVVSGASDTNVKVWDLRQKAAIATYKEHDKAVWAIDISPDTQFIASGCTGGLVKMWDLTSGKCAHTFDIKSLSNSENVFIKDIKFNPADWCIAIAWSDKVIRYYDTCTYELINETSADVHPICSIDFEPDGEIVLSAYSDSVKVWDLEQRKLVSMVSKTARPIFDLKCSTEKDFTFVLENVNGALGLSEIETSLLLNKNGDLQNYEEEKNIDSSPKFENGMNYIGSGPKNNNLMNNPTSHQANPPLDFYKAPANGVKIQNGKILNSGFDYVYGIEDSNDLENIEETSYESPALNKENSYPKTNEQAQLPRKLSLKQKSRK